MRCRRIGSTEWQVSEIGFGAWQIGGDWGAATDADSIRTPRHVRIDLLPPLDEAPGIDPGDNKTGPQRHDPSDPLFGFFGPDPRRFGPAAAIPLRDTVVDWLLADVEGRPQAGIQTW